MAEPTVRAARREDAHAIADLCNAMAQASRGEDDLTAAAVAEWFERPRIAFFAAERDGVLVAYADVADEDGEVFPIDLRLHPERADATVADELLLRCEAWARERGRPGARTRGYVPDGVGLLRAALDRRGYRLTRSSLTMLREPLGQVEEPRWPPGIAVRTFRAGEDDVRLYEAIAEGFAEDFFFRAQPYEEWRRLALEGSVYDPSLMFLAEEGDAIAGVAVCQWHRSGDPHYGWVSELTVLKPWRRRGLALALLRHAFQAFAARGATKVGLGVDAENETGAVALYERAGMRKVHRADNLERTL